MKADEVDSTKKIENNETISDQRQGAFNLGCPLIVCLMWPRLVGLCCDAPLSILVFRSVHIVCITKESYHKGLFQTEKVKQILFVHKEVNQLKNRKLYSENEVLKLWENVPSPNDLAEWSCQKTHFVNRAEKKVLLLSGLS